MVGVDEFTIGNAMFVVLIVLVAVVYFLGRPGARPAIIVERHIDINAAPEQVWQVLMDADHYPDWHPNLKGFDLHGGETVGAKVALRIDGEPPAILKFVTSKVIAYERAHNMVWDSRIGWLMGFIHHFRVDTLGGGQSRFVQYEEFTGIVSWVLRLLVRSDNPKSLQLSVGAGHDAMNQGLKRAVEARGG